MIWASNGSMAGVHTVGQEYGVYPHGGDTFRFAEYRIRII